MVKYLEKGQILKLNKKAVSESGDPFAVISEANLEHNTLAS